MMPSLSQSERNGRPALASNLPLAAKLTNFRRRTTRAARIGFVLLACSIPLSAALAQDANPFNGKWEASYTVGTYPVRAEVVIADDGGSYTSNLTKGYGCSGIEFPLTVRSHSATDIVFTVNQSKRTGCPNFSVTAKIVDANTLEGAFKSGNPMKLVRK